jgi:ribosomal small subunit protein bTHX
MVAFANGIDRNWAMGKGDVRTRRGKIYNGSYGKKRPHHVKKKAAEPKPLGRRPG